jgi:L-lactate dehydrogenase
MDSIMFKIENIYGRNLALNNGMVLKFLNLVIELLNMNQAKVGIIGMGWVGSSIAISLLHKGVCKELMLNDARPGIAEGEAMDLNHGSSFYSSANVKAAEIEEMINCDIVVITAGRGGKPGETRLQLLSENVKIAKAISEQLSGFKGILVIVSNPVDVLTYFYQKFTGLKKEKVIGTGTLLDTARLRDIIGHELNIAPKSIHAQVIGEHGDSEVVLWSGASIGGFALNNWESWSIEKERIITDKVKNAAYEIIKRKGATNHAIGLVTASLIKWILRDEQRVVTVSAITTDLNDFPEIAFSLPTLLGKDGVNKLWLPEMSLQEKEALYQSAHVINQAINSVNI